MDLATLDRSVEDIDLMCRIVRAAPPERFSMAAWCGSSACVAGWCYADRAFRTRLGPDAEGHPECLTAVAVPAMVAAPLFCRPSLFESAHEDGSPALWRESPEWFVYGVSEQQRASAIDDAPFTATPVEIACLGADYARGLAEREAALNRLAIVRACLVKWRAALAPTVAREIETRQPTQVSL